MVLVFTFYFFFYMLYLLPIHSEQASHAISAYSTVIVNFTLNYIHLNVGYHSSPYTQRHWCRLGLLQKAMLASWLVPWWEKKINFYLYFIDPSLSSHHITLQGYASWLVPWYCSLIGNITQCSLRKLLSRVIRWNIVWRHNRE